MTVAAHVGVDEDRVHERLGRGAHQAGPGGLAQPRQTSTGRSTSGSIPRSCAPPKWTTLIGDPTKAKFDLDWEPTVDFDRLVRMMVDADAERLTTGG